MHDLVMFSLYTYYTILHSWLKLIAKNELQRL